jgi:septum formation protein
MHLYLASRSPQRLRLLQQAGHDVTVVPSAVDEPPTELFPSPEAYVLCASCLKASAARPRVPAGVIVAADTLAVVAGNSLGKPRDRDDARRMLQLLSGSTHAVLSGLCLCTRPDDVFLAAVETTRLRMRPWSDAEIDAYLNSGKWNEKAGAYAIEVAHDPFVVHREGSLTNVVGLPTERLEELLHRAALHHCDHD